jgi:hypothetical protein
MVDISHVRYTMFDDYGNTLAGGCDESLNTSAIHEWGGHQNRGHIHYHRTLSPHPIPSHPTHSSGGDDLASRTDRTITDYRLSTDCTTIAIPNVHIIMYKVGGNNNTLEGLGGPVRVDEYTLEGIDPTLEDCCRREVRT